MTYDTLSFVTYPNEVGAYDIAVSVNDVLAEWKTSYSYEFSFDYTPNVTSVSPTQVNGAQIMTISGLGLTMDTTVMIGSESCLVQNASDTQLICQLDGLDLGAQNISVNVLRMKSLKLELYYEL